LFQVPHSINPSTPTRIVLTQAA